DCTVRVRRVPDGVELGALQLQAALRTCDITPDGRRVVAVDVGGRLTFWDVESRSTIRTVEGCPLADVAVTPDGAHVVGRAPDATALWDLASGAEVWRRSVKRLAKCFALSADGSKLATPEDNEAVTVVDLARPKLPRRIPMNIGGVRTMRFSHD